MRAAKERSLKKKPHMHSNLSAPILFVSNSLYGLKNGTWNYVTWCHFWQLQYYRGNKCACLESQPGKRKIDVLFLTNRDVLKDLMGEDGTGKSIGNWFALRIWRDEICGYDMCVMRINSKCLISSGWLVTRLTMWPVVKSLNDKKRKGTNLK